MPRVAKSKPSIVEDILPPSVPPQPQRGSARFSPLAAALIVIVLVTAGILGAKQLWFSAPEKASVPQPPEAQTAATPEDVRALIAKVAKHISVKAEEDPTVATIQDIEILKRQNPAFYAEAQNGDRLLIWSDKAVLYSSTRDLILSVLPISLPSSAVGQQAGQSTSTAAAPETPPTEQATVEVRNGTGTAGMAKALNGKLAELGLKTLTPTDAKKKDYAKTVIVKLTDKALPQSLQAIQTAAGESEVGELPAGELASQADFLVIVGATFRK